MTSQVSFGKIVSKDENNELHVYTAGLAPPPLNPRDSTAECRNGGLDPDRKDGSSIRPYCL